MAGYSRAQIVEGMKGKAITLGWGAVSAFSRARLNHLLDQQYLSRLHELRYLPPFDGDVEADGVSGWVEQLRMIEFGAPRLSFHTASMDDSKAMLTMEIIGGRRGKRNTLDGSVQGQGDIVRNPEEPYYVELEVDLTMALGIVDRRGRVTLDLAKGVKFNSNLLTGEAAKKLNLALEQWFAQLPAHRTVFELGYIDYDGFTYLAPERFILRTQPAPGALIKGTDSYGDGAVLAFMRLAGNTSDGQQPTASFPYLIPNDSTPSGEGYSATLVVANNLLEHVRDDRLEVLNSLLFPGQQVFREVGRDIPHDLAVFGEITAHPALLTVSPATVTLPAGGKHRFELHDYQGNKLPVKAWRALSVKSHRDEGDGTMENNEYTAASASAMGHETLTVIITAQYEVRPGGPGIEPIYDYASARVTVMREDVELATRLVSLLPDTQSVDLVGAHVAGETLPWKLSGPELGTLQPSGAGAVFTPSSTRRKAPIALQQIQADADGQVRASVLLLRSRYPVEMKSATENNSSRIDGTTQQRVKPGQSVNFTFNADEFIPAATNSWRALGDGTVDASGNYTAPDTFSSGGDAVVCDREYDGVRYSGASRALQITTLEEESSWNTLIAFKLSRSVKRPFVYGNGYQQQQIDIEVETADVDGKPCRLTPTEQASLVLVEAGSHSGVPALLETSQGIEDGTTYATRTTRNAFRQYPLPSVDDEPYEQRQKATDGRVSLTRFLHVNDTTATKASFYARFRKDNGGEFTSLETDPINGTVDVDVKELPKYVESRYTMTRKRVMGTEPPVESPPNDEYYFHYRTRDYWQFAFDSALFMMAKITTLRDVGSDNKIPVTSMIRWESEHRNEIMASYTGFIFEDRVKPLRAHKESEPLAKFIEFDEELDKVIGSSIKEWGKEIDHTQFSSGTAVICNDRYDDIPYKPLGDRAYLAGPIGVMFVDEDGNPHYVEFSHGAKGTAGNRNIVSWKLNWPKL